MSITQVTEKESHLTSMLRTCTEALKQVTAERDALKADAERYQWLRCGLALTVQMTKQTQIYAPVNHVEYAEKLDAAIDAAMKGKS